MGYWLGMTLVCCMVGYLIAIRNRIDWRVGISQGMAFSILFHAGLYNEFRTYEPPLKVLLVAFLTLLCLTLLLLLERRALVGWLQLSALTFLVSVLTHHATPDSAYAQKVEAALDYVSERYGTSTDFGALMSTAEEGAQQFSKKLSGESSTLVKVREDTFLFDPDGIVSEQIDAGTWALVQKKTIEENGTRLTGVEVLAKDGSVEQAGYVDESSFGIQVTVPRRDVLVLASRDTVQPSP